MRISCFRIACFAATAAASLVTTSALADGPKEHGGWGEAFVAPMLGKVSGLQGSLQSPSLLGPSYSSSAYETQIGGGGAFLLSRHWIAKLIGFGIVGGENSTGNGSAKLLAGGGTLQVGYVFLNDDDWLAWPYLGLGGMGVSPRVENHTSQNMAFGQAVVAPGASSYPGIGAFTGEFGIAIRRLFPFGDGGFVVGAELGGLVTLAHNSWSDQTGVAIQGLGSGALDGGYLRITIGGGSFVEKGEKPQTFEDKKEKREERAEKREERREEKAEKREEQKEKRDGEKTDKDKNEQP